MSVRQYGVCICLAHDLLFLLLLLQKSCRLCIGICSASNIVLTLLLLLFTAWFCLRRNLLMIVATARCKYSKMDPPARKITCTRKWEWTSQGSGENQTIHNVC